MWDICSECGDILTSSEHDHGQVPLSVFGVHAHVDEGIAALIEACWEIGIGTTASCQGDPETGRAYIGFERGAAERFIGAATIENLDDPATIEAEALGWRLREVRSEEDPQAWTWLPGGWPWSVGFAAHFPPADIAELTRRLRRWVHDAP